MELRVLNREDAKKEYAFFKELKSENGFENTYENITYDEFVNHAIDERIQCSLGKGLPEGYVPDTFFFLWDHDEIVGLFKVRHYLNDFLRKRAGHIGYGILPRYRQKGYAKAGLKLAIEELKKLPDFKEDEIYMSCLKENKASLKVQLANGAYIHHEDDKEYYTRIKVK